MIESSEFPGPADVGYFTQAQAGGWGETLRGFARFLALLPGSHVLDVGTGPGLLPRLLAADGTAVGCDDSPEMIRKAAELGRQDACGPAWTVADALRLPFAHGAFDAALATNLLFLLPDPGSGIASLARVTRSGGTVGFLNPSERMSIAAAEAFAAQRGLQGFGRFSLLNYGRLAEEHHRLGAKAWNALAAEAGLADVWVETRAGGLILFVKGRKL